MRILRKWLTLSAIALFPITSGWTQQDTGKTTATAQPLTSEEMKQAVTVDAITVPTPGEFFKAIDKGGKPNWSSQFRPPTQIDGTSRAQMALNLGTLIADGYIAVEAQDGQQVKNIGRDVLTLAKKLSVSDSVIARGKSISQFAESGAWDQLNEELEATQNEVKKALEENRDTDLITLVSIGGWIRGTQVVSGSVAANYDERSAKVLRQPALVNFIHAKLNDVSPQLRNDPLVKNVGDQLTTLEKLVAFPPGKVPSIEDVRKVNGVVTELMREIQTKTDAR